MIWVWKGKNCFWNREWKGPPPMSALEKDKRTLLNTMVSFQTNMTATRHSNWWARVSPWGSPFLLLGSGVCEFRKPQLPYLFILTWRYVYGFRERGKGVGREGKGDRAGGRGGEEREDQLPLIYTPTRDWIYTLGMCPVGNRTCNFSVHRTILQPIELLNQGSSLTSLIKNPLMFFICSTRTCFFKAVWWFL